jgi:hypothetical protein
MQRSSVPIHGPGIPRVLLRYQIPVIGVRVCGEQDPLLTIPHEVVLEKRNRDPCAGT